MLYNVGHCVKEDKKKAAEFYKSAADKGLPLSCYNLGNMYSEGEGVEKDMKKAVYYWQIACDKNYADALNFEQSWFSTSYWKELVSSEC